MFSHWQVAWKWSANSVSTKRRFYHGGHHKLEPAFGVWRRLENRTQSCLTNKSSQAFGAVRFQFFKAEARFVSGRFQMRMVRTCSGKMLLNPASSSLEALQVITTCTLPSFQNCGGRIFLSPQFVCWTRGTGCLPHKLCVIIFCWFLFVTKSLYLMSCLPHLRLSSVSANSDIQDIKRVTCFPGPCFFWFSLPGSWQTDHEKPE